MASNQGQSNLIRAISRTKEPAPCLLLQYNPANVDQATRDLLFPNDRSELRYRRESLSRDEATGAFPPVVVGRLFTTAGDVTRDAGGEEVGVAITISNEYVSRKHVSFNLIGQRGSFKIEMTNHGLPLNLFNNWTGRKDIIHTDETVKLRDGQTVIIRFRGTSLMFKTRIQLESEDYDEDTFVVVVEESDDVIEPPAHQTMVIQAA